MKKLLFIMFYIFFVINITHAEYIGCFEPSETVYATIQFNGVAGESAATSVSARVYDPDDTTTPTATPTIEAVDATTTNALGLYRGSFSVGPTPMQGTWTIRYKGTVDSMVRAATDTFDVMDVAGECATRGTVTVGNMTGYSLSSTGLDAIPFTATGVQAITDAIWDEVIVGAHNINNSAGKRLRLVSGAIPVEGTVTANPTTISFDGDAALSSVDDFYNERVLMFNSGALNTVAIIVTNYIGSTRTFVFDYALPLTPSINDTFALQSTHIHPVSQIVDNVWDEISTGHTDAGKAGQQLWTDVDAILADTGTDGVVVASGSKTGYSLTDGSITAAKFASGAIDATVIADGALLTEQGGIYGTLSASSTSTSLISTAFVGTDTSDYVGWVAVVNGGTAIVKSFNPTTDTVTLASSIGTVNTGDVIKLIPESLYEILYRARLIR